MTVKNKIKKCDEPEHMLAEALFKKDWVTESITRMSHKGHAGWLCHIGFGVQQHLYNMDTYVKPKSNDRRTHVEPVTFYELTVKV